MIEVTYCPGLRRYPINSNDYRLGHILDVLFAANLNTVFSAVTLKALEVYGIPTPWLHQDTTTIALYGAYKDEPQTPRAPTLPLAIAKMDVTISSRCCSVLE